MNIDIKEFFNSIYTHSLEWAVVGGKSLVKIGKSTKPKKQGIPFSNVSMRYVWISTITKPTESL